MLHYGNTLCTMAPEMLFNFNCIVVMHSDMKTSENFCNRDTCLFLPNPAAVNLIDFPEISYLHRHFYLKP